ncbi:MAG: hypothetical protein IJU04_02175, partial [Ruminococcus sp.]|nr:hypothetical protein [Ruminococcus sp.]
MMLSFAITSYGATVNVKTDVPPNMVFLGDSITTGFGLEGYDSGKEACKSYPITLYGKYSKELEGKCTTSMKNYAIDGQTSGGLLKKLNSGTYDEALNDADAIVVSIGGNDLLSVLKEFITNDLNLNMKKRPTKAEIANIIDSITSLSSRIDNNLEAYDSNISEI